MAVKTVRSSDRLGNEILVCSACGATVARKGASDYFPEGYSYGECPKCKNEVDTASPVTIAKRDMYGEEN